HGAQGFLPLAAKGINLGLLFRAEGHGESLSLVDTPLYLAEGVMAPSRCMTGEERTPDRSPRAF
ncbi:MAG: hypothetical protein P8X69_12910, partial [Maritimibacter sp.]